MRGRASISAMVARLLIVAFAVRALVPLGFMPDLAALDDGRIEVVICTGDGQQLISLDASGKRVDNESTDDDSAECPFAATFAKAVPATIQWESGTVRLDRAELPRLKGGVVLAIAPRGPPLGSRAPPFPQG